MIDQKTLAYINLYAVLGTLENLCELAPEASSLLTNKKPISIGFEVKGGPSATITFANGRCRMEQGCTKCDVKLPFASCEKFNGLIDGTVTPIPSKGFLHIGFLLKDFTALTDLLNKYMRPEPADLEDPDFFRISTTLMLDTITVAIAQIGNNDEIGKFSIRGASSIADQAANIILIQRNLAKERKREDKNLTPDEDAQMADVTLNLAKHRNGDWQGRAPLWFCPQSTAYSTSAERTVPPLWNGDTDNLDDVPY